MHIVLVESSLFCLYGAIMLMHPPLRGTHIWLKGTVEKNRFLLYSYTTFNYWITHPDNIRIDCLYTTNIYIVVTTVVRKHCSNGSMSEEHHAHDAIDIVCTCCVWHMFFFLYVVLFHIVLFQFFLVHQLLYSVVFCPISVPSYLSPLLPTHTVVWPSFSCAFLWRCPSWFPHRCSTHHHWWCGLLGYPYPPTSYVLMKKCFFTQPRTERQRECIEIYDTSQTAGCPRESIQSLGRMFSPASKRLRLRNSPSYLIPTLPMWVLEHCNTCSELVDIWESIVVYTQVDSVDRDVGLFVWCHPPIMYQRSET